MDALPDRHQVEIRGTPGPPNSRYYVLDYVNDLEARIILRRLVTNYRRLKMDIRADELERALNESEKDVAAWVEARNAAAKKREGSPRGRGRKKINPIS